MKIRKHHFLSSCVLPLLLCAPAALVATAPACAQPAENRVLSDDVPRALLDRLLKIVAARPQLVSAGGQRVVFVGAEPIRVKSDAAGPLLREAPTLYRLTHYRYADDVTVFTTVDIARNTVVASREAKHTPTPITADELAEATRLALADEKLRAALGKQIDGVQTETLGLYTDDRKDPLYGHRALSLVFHHGDLYVANLEVIVDLTARRVSVTRRSSGNEMHH